MNLLRLLKPCLVVLLAISFFILACDSKSPVETNETVQSGNSLISECSGFVSVSKSATGDFLLDRDEDTYCDAERLHWLYDEAAKTLKVKNSRVLLNCCGEHEITATTENGIIVIHEDDLTYRITFSEVFLSRAFCYNG